MMASGYSAPPYQNFTYLLSVIILQLYRSHISGIKIHRPQPCTYNRTMPRLWPGYIPCYEKVAILASIIRVQTYRYSRFQWLELRSIYTLNSETEKVFTLENLKASAILIYLPPPKCRSAWAYRKYHNWVIASEAELLDVRRDDIWTDPSDDAPRGILCCGTKLSLL